MVPFRSRGHIRIRCSHRPYVVANTDQFTAVRAADGTKLILPWDDSGPDRPAAYDLSRDPRERTPAALEGTALEDLLVVLKRLRAQGLRPEQGEDEPDPETLERLRQMGYVDR